MGFTLLGILNAQAVVNEVPEPDFLTSAPLWFDAADLDTITASSSSVSQWDNKGTLGNLIQSSSADQPSTGTVTQNGLNVIDFNFEFFNFSGVASDVKFLHDGTEYFWAMAITTRVPDVADGIFLTHRGSSTETGAGFLLTSTGDWNYSVNRGVQSTAVFNSTTEGLIVENQFQILTMNLDPTNATALDRGEKFANNSVGVKDNTSDSAVNTGNPSRNLVVGALGDETRPMVGQIGEFIVVRGADATEANRQQVVDYLNFKWGAF